MNGAYFTSFFFIHKTNKQIKSWTRQCLDIASIDLRVVQYTQTESDWRRSSTTRLTGSLFARDLVNIHQSFCGWSGKCGKRTPSDSVGDGLPLQESIGLTASQFARDLVNIHQSGVSLGVENVGKRTPSDPMETGWRDKSPSDSPQVSSLET